MVRICGLVLALSVALSPARAELPNGGLEELTEEGLPVGWFLPPTLEDRGYRIEIDTENPYAGERAAVIDATEAYVAGTFGNLMQSIDATPFRGKRVRFKAAVRTAGNAGPVRAQLWFRVDLPKKDGRRRIGAFDNMSDRPIRTEEWEEFEIVAQVEENAWRIALGMMVHGVGKAWIDDVTLVVVDDETSTTARVLGATGGDGPQPFFNHWLWLVAISLALMLWSQVPPHDSGSRRFAFRFAVVYWVLYSFPMPFSLFTSWTGIDAAYEYTVDKIVRFTAPAILGIERELVPPGGSGDTTFDYVRLFVCFVLALLGGAIWSAFGRRETDQATTRDLLRSYLRYVLAFTMLSYGLAKTGWVMNQFPEPGIEQLNKTYGDSSPMNLLWTLMGASRPYTIFAGLGEVTGALLLVWRRTAVLGALVLVGVMLNVVMLNFCFDVPVKQYSFHLWLMAIYILLPDAGRLTNLLLFNRPTERADLAPPYAGTKAAPFRYAVKTILILFGIMVPLGAKVVREIRHDPTLGAPAFFGSYRVEEFVRDGETLPHDDPERWKLFTIRRVPWSYGDFVSIRLSDDSRLRGASALRPGEESFSVDASSPLVPLLLTVESSDEERLTLAGTLEDGRRIEVAMRRDGAEGYLLMNRGFRWVNEYPFNR